MLIPTNMLSSKLALAAIAATTTAATAGPDFVANDVPSKKLAASDARTEITPQDDVLFAYDSAAVDALAEAQIATAARWLARHPRYRVVLEGRTDSSGAAEYNEDLAMRRAQSVRDQLMRHGVPVDRVLLVVFGESGADPTPNALDRHVVLYATDLPVDRIVDASLHARDAHSVTWIQNGALFMDTRGTASPTPTVAGR
jgi:OmpA family protein